MYNVAGHFELFDGDFAVPREEQDIPVFEPHREHEFDNATRGSRRRIEKEKMGNQSSAKKTRQRAVLRGPNVPSDIPRLALSR